MKRQRKEWESIVGRTFGRLTVMQEIGDTAVCRCSCGKLHMPNKHMLPNGNTSSCGCLKKEMMSKLGKTKGPKKSKWIDVLNTIANL